MEGFTSLLIIASAFSVFGQYLDNIHQKEIEHIKNKAEQIDIADHWAEQVRKNRDDLISKPCKRAKRYVFALFVFLLVMLAIVAWNSVAKLTGWNEVNGEWRMVVSSCMLLMISISLGYRLWNMSQERSRFERDLGSLQETADAIKNTLEAQGSGCGPAD